MTRQVVLGIVLFLVFWAFSADYGTALLGQFQWFAGALIFSFLPWLVEMGRKKQKPPENMKQMWMFATLFVVVTTFVGSFLMSYLGAVIPAGTDITPIFLSLWLVIFGGAGLMHGISQKEYVWSVIGLVWIVTAIQFSMAGVFASNAYLHFALIVGISFALAGIVTKKK